MIYQDQVFYGVIFGIGIIYGALLGYHSAIKHLENNVVINHPKKRFNLWSKGTYTFTPEDTK